VQTQNKQSLFEQLMLPHLDAAYNLARRLTGNNQDADDMVQDAYLRAFKAFPNFRGEDSRAWLLTIVRNTCFTWLQRNHPSALQISFDEDEFPIEDTSQNTEKLLLEQIDHEMLHQALQDLPIEHREAIVLREMEGMSYKEIALVTRVPLGTVMSRLARARRRLYQILSKRMNGD